MNILLTNQKWDVDPRNPISILDMAPYGRKMGHEVDCYYTNNLPDKQYDKVGLSVIAGSAEAAMRPLIELRDKYGVAPVLGGKITTTLTPEETSSFEAEGVEIWRGAGEFMFSSDPIDFESYPSWEWIDFHTLQFSSFELMTMRGCPFNCHFCHNTESRISTMSLNRSVDNAQLLRTLGHDLLFMVDDVFVTKPARALEMYSAMRCRGLEVDHKFRFFVHVKLVNDKTLEVVKTWKPDQVELGLESGDDRMLKEMGKGFTSAEAYDAIRRLGETGVKVCLLILCGFPGETVESLENTVAFVEKVLPYTNGGPVHAFYYQPVPGTVGYTRAMERSSITNDLWNRRVAYVDPNLTEEQLVHYVDGILEKMT